MLYFQKCVSVLSAMGCIVTGVILMIAATITVTVVIFCLEEDKWEGVSSQSERDCVFFFGFFLEFFHWGNLKPVSLVITLRL